MLTRDCYNAVGFGGALLITAGTVGAFLLWHGRGRVAATVRRGGDR
ncbi:hypothetical protein [Mycobacteroides abscessus]|nr:hypothetical protein [Mycobacteroides abscessus]